MAALAIRLTAGFIGALMYVQRGVVAIALLEKNRREEGRERNKVLPGKDAWEAQLTLLYSVEANCNRDCGEVDIGAYANAK